MREIERENVAFEGPSEDAWRLQTKVGKNHWKSKQQIPQYWHLKIELKTSELNNQKLEGEVERLKNNLEEVKTLERGGVKRKATTSKENRKNYEKNRGKFRCLTCNASMSSKNALVSQQY